MTRNLIGRRAAVAGALGGIAAAHSRIAWAADPIKIGFSIPQSGGLAAIGKQALFPIWKRDTRELIRTFQEQRFRAVAVCIDSRVLAPGFAGRELDESFFRDLPPQADPCGENGEFHTFVFDAPIFQFPIPVRTGEIVNREGFLFCDLLPQTEGATK